MISKKELQDWLKAIPDDGFLAIDDGGLIMVALDPEGNETKPYIEVGGIPLPDDEPESNEPIHILHCGRCFMQGKTLYNVTGCPEHEVKP